MMRRALFTILIVVLSVGGQLPAGAETRLPEKLALSNSQLRELYLQGKHTEAIPVARNMVELSERNLGKSAPETAIALDNLAKLYIAKGLYAEAEQLSLKALEIYKKIGGESKAYQPYAAFTLMNLANIYQKTGRREEGRKFYQKATEIRDKAPGKTIPFTVVKPLEAMQPRSLPKIGSEPETGSFWNTWFEDEAKGRQPTRIPEIGRTYFLVLDMSNFAYFQKTTVAVSPQVKKIIEKALEDGDTVVRFTIRPILHGGFFRFAPGQESSLPLTVDLKKLQASDEAKQKMYKNFWAEKEELKLLKLRDLVREVGAGEVSFKLDAVREGQASISFSIWDRNGMIPLDHLTLSVPVVGLRTHRERPGSASRTELTGGLGTLLDVSRDFSTTGPLLPDAAFYIFEPEANEKSTVLFAARTVPAGPGDIAVKAWETETLLSDYIGDRNGLLAKIKRAREKAIKPEENCYEGAADRLGKKIFPPGEAQAQEARKILSDLVEQKTGDNPLVFVRMVNQAHDPVYLPLGILAAKSQSPILKKRITLVQPLPRENYPGNATPVGTWTFGIPRELKGFNLKSPKGKSPLDELTFSDYWRPPHAGISPRSGNSWIPLTSHLLVPHRKDCCCCPITTVETCGLMTRTKRSSSRK